MKHSGIVLGCRQIVVILLFMFVAAALSAQPSGLKLDASGGTTTELSQYGITWTFAEPVEFGQFVNGDYWVVGPVTVVEVDPAPAVVNGNYVHGSMINPRLGSQGYDSRTTRSRAPYDSTSRVQFPVTIQPDASLISSISRDLNNEAPIPVLKSAAVLTVIRAPAHEDAFRPGLIGDDKPQYRAGSIRWDLLPNLSETPSAPDSLYYYERSFQRPWLLHNGSWTSRYISPTDNMPDYHQDIAILLSHGAVAMLTDLGVDRTELVINYLQVAIDYYTMQQSPGEGRYNYRWPIVFAGIMLGNDSMRFMWKNGDYGTSAYQDDKIYLWADSVRTKRSAILPVGETWTGHDVFWRIKPGEYAPNQFSHEELHPNEWDWIEQEGYPGGGTKQESYRRMHSVSTVGFGLAALAFGAQDEFDFDIYFDYADRWMSETEGFLESKGHGVDGIHPVQTSKSTFVDEMWTAHRSKF
jgi:hypothetical protein